MATTQDLRAAIAAVPERSVAARLRPLMPEIDQRVRDGASHEAIVDALKGHGVTLTLATFRSYLYRWRKAQGQPAVAPEPRQPAAPVPRPSPTQASAAAPTEAPPRIRNKGDLARLRETTYDLEELARRAADAE